MAVGLTCMVLLAMLISYQTGLIRATDTFRRVVISATLGIALFYVLSIVLSLFHAAHRFRFTLYDGLQIKHLNEMIGVFCYGGAIVLSFWAGFLLWRLA